MTSEGGRNLNDENMLLEIYLSFTRIKKLTLIIPFLCLNYIVGGAGGMFSWDPTLFSYSDTQYICSIIFFISLHIFLAKIQIFSRVLAVILFFYNSYIFATFEINFELS